MKRNFNLTTKALAALLAGTLMFGGAVGGTIAWLTDDAKAVVNTFTYGDIKIDLWETDVDGNKTETGLSDLKIVPGTDISKDPTVTVAANSEPCWLFVKVEKAGDWSEKVTYSINDNVEEEPNWTALDGYEGIYWMKVGATTAAKDIRILKDNIVSVSTELSKTDLVSIENNPTLTFTAYAIQQDNIGSKDATDAVNAVTAWETMFPKTSSEG